MVVPQNPAEGGTCGTGGSEMRVFLSYGSRRCVEPVVAIAVGCGLSARSCGACAQPDCAAAEGSDALVATSVMPAGEWR